LSSSFALVGRLSSARAFPLALPASQSFFQAAQLGLRLA
jgi:hypothetical protein